MTVHSPTYYPDCIITGGVDGLIKLWNLRTPTTIPSSSMPMSSSSLSTSSFRPSPRNTTGTSTASSSGGGGDALSILSGHGGKVLCLKSAWHGDHLLSGGADRDRGVVIVVIDQLSLYGQKMQ